MRFEEGEEKPSRWRQNPSAILYDEHVPVAAKLADLKGVKLSCPEFLLDGVGGQDCHSNASQDSLFDRLVAAEFESDPKFTQ